MALIGISPVVLLVIVILAIGFFILGLVQILVRFLTNPPSFPSVSRANSIRDSSNSHALQRQLQHLFRMHDSGLDQAVIDALPVFYYKDITGGAKEPFDCAVCLCEFSEGDRLRLVPNCSHAFHAHCIETWLLSNSTCPLCRSHIACNNVTQQCTLPHPDQFANPHLENAGPARVFSIFLGKFRSANENEGVNNTSCSSTIDARRCFSMGSFRYIVNDANLQVALRPNNHGAVCNYSTVDIGKRISPRSTDDSFSLSKIWQWSKKDRFPSIDDTNERAMLPMPNRSNLA